MKRIDSHLGIRSKKANALADSVTAFIVITIFVLIGIVGWITLSEINTDFQASDYNDNISKAALQNLETKYPSWLDNAGVFIFVMLWIIALIGAYLIDAHPVFFVVIVIGLIVLMGSMTYVANAFNEVLSSDDFAQKYGQLTKIKFIIDHIILIMMVMAFSIIIVMMGKPAQ